MFRATNFVEKRETRGQLSGLEDLQFCADTFKHLRKSATPVIDDAGTRRAQMRDALADHQTEALNIRD
jgi:hypothetical protein